VRHPGALLRKPSAAKIQRSTSAVLQKSAERDPKHVHNRNTTQIFVVESAESERRGSELMLNDRVRYRHLATGMYLAISGTATKKQPAGAVEGGRCCSALNTASRAESIQYHSKYLTTSIWRVFVFQPVRSMARPFYSSKVMWTRQQCFGWRVC
jgi:hypothetical protein